MSIPVYVVSDDQLVDRSVLGDRLYEGTTAVVKETDHLAEVKTLEFNAQEWRDTTDLIADDRVKAERERIARIIKDGPHVHGCASRLLPHPGICNCLRGDILYAIGENP